MCELANDPFSGFTEAVNHIGDIDVFHGKRYAGVETFEDGEAGNKQIAVYGAETLELICTRPFDGKSGQTEVSGMPKGSWQGYDREIHEIFAYDRIPRDQERN